MLDFKFSFEQIFKEIFLQISHFKININLKKVMNRIGTTKVVGCPRMVKTALSQKCASSNGRFRKKLTLIPLVPLPQEQPDCHHHPHHQ